MMLSDRPDTAWCVIDGVAVGLDIAADRYFRLDEAQNAQFLANASPEWLDRPHQPVSFPLPDDWERPQTRSAAIDDGSFRLGDVARSIWMQHRIERRLATRSFAQVLSEARDTIGCRTAKDIVQSKQAQRDIRAFQHARLLRTAADRCLPRSIALALCLARHGCRVHVVLGVKLAPFAAHCWAQNRGEVLNDELEEVRRYTPILVL
ncbi:lasso peptide biosynthesis B2 protein [Novosphingobium kunmingense]|nr:lasso peptide biosynthesis B2 protein [Novosphingobium kunmingense]